MITIVSPRSTRSACSKACSPIFSNSSVLLDREVSTDSTPQISVSPFMTSREEVSAMMRCSGLRDDRRPAINPDSVKTAMMRVFISSAANAAASQRARLTRPLCFPTSLLMIETRNERGSIISKLVGKQSGRVSRALCEAAAFAADEMNTRIIAVFTESGLMAGRLSSLRPEQRIIALTSSREVMNGLTLIWGVESVLTSRSRSTEELLKIGEQALLQADLVDLGETIVIMAGRLSGLGLSSSVTLYTVEGDIHETV